MGKNHREYKTKYDLDRIMQESFGCSDDQLLLEMRLAEKEVDDSQIPCEKEDGLEKLMAEIKRRGLVAHYDNTMDRNDECEKRKIRCIGPIIRVALAVGILASVLVMTSLQAGAKRSYEYNLRAENSEKNNVVVNNSDVIEERALELAYKDIHDQLGIEVLKLGDVPEGTAYSETLISEKRATMYFKCHGASIYLLQQIGTSENSVNIISDRKDKISVYNEWLDRDIVIDRAVVDSGIELSSTIINGNSYYYVAGIIEEKEFKKMVKDLRFNKE